MPAVDVLGLVGTVVEPVRFDACVDSGGFGLVYRAHHLQLDTDVAVKCLRVSNLGHVDEELRQTIFSRFRDETRLLYRLSQGCLDIVRCIGSGELEAPATGEQTPYMILEWLDGWSLGAELRERRERGQGGRTLDEAIQLLDSAVNALAFAHAQGVVHRDVKPANLFFTKTPHGMRLKVLDFGLAKILADEGSIGMRPSAVTGVGVHFCSPSYGAPEQFSSNVGPVGPWTDVYSLTLVLLEVMKGAKIRPASNLAEGLVKALDPKTGSPRPSEIGLHVSRAVDDLVARALAQNPLERPRDAGMFWSALKDLARQGPAMMPTVADASVVEHMEQVRAAQTAQTARVPKALAPPADARNRLAGTVVMAPAQAPPPRMAPSAPPAAPAMPPAGTPPFRHGAPGTMPRTNSMAPPARPPAKSGGGWLAAVFVFLAIVIVGGGAIVALWYFRLR